MSNTTTREFSPGPLYTRLWTERMMEGLAEARRRYGFRVVAGGGGAWQYLHWPDGAARHGIDTVFDGYFEADGPAMVLEILEARRAPARHQNRDTAADRAEPIRGPSTMGVIELSRGCGNGCRFCLMAGRRMVNRAALPHQPPCEWLV